MPTVFNAANELAVSAFLAGRLPFLGIAEAIAKAMRIHHVIEMPSVGEILETEQWVRQEIQIDRVP